MEFTGLPLNGIYTLNNRYTQAADCAFTITGDLLEPKYKDGDILLVKQQETIEEYDLAVWLVNNEPQIKRKVGNRLVSLVPTIEDIPIDKNCKLFGSIIGAADFDWIVGIEE